MPQRRQYEIWAEATADMFQYIEIFYNRQRRHSSIGQRSPDQLEAEAEGGNSSGYISLELVSERGTGDTKEGDHREVT